MEEFFIPPILKSGKPEAESNQLSKIYYGKAAASEKAASKCSSFGWAFGFWGQKPKPKVQPNGSLAVTRQHMLFTATCIMKLCFADQEAKEEGINSDLLYSLAKGPDFRARVFNRCFINCFLFRTASIQKNLTTRNSGVYVKGDSSTGNMAWYGVLKKITTLDFANEKEVVLFQCDWYDVPAQRI